MPLALLSFFLSFFLHLKHTDLKPCHQPSHIDPAMPTPFTLPSTPISPSLSSFPSLISLLAFLCFLSIDLFFFFLVILCLVSKKMEEMLKILNEVDILEIFVSMS